MKHRRWLVIGVVLALGILPIQASEVAVGRGPLASGLPFVTLDPGPGVNVGVERVDPRTLLTVDPTYVWHTFYGSEAMDEGGASVAVDGNDLVYVAGSSEAGWNGPSGQVPLHAFAGGGYTDRDVTVVKLDGNGAYQWHTFYGSNLDDDAGFGIAEDGSGNVYVTGYSRASWDGPSGQPPLHAFTPGEYGAGDLMVMKLDSDGAYQWHTFYGSSFHDVSFGIALDGSGNVYITGLSGGSWDGPSGQPPLHAHYVGEDLLVVKLDSNGAYQWHTFYGSNNVDHGLSVAADESGNVYVTGHSEATWSGPSGQPPLHANSGMKDLWVLKLSGAGAYQWHTFYGSNVWDEGNGIAADGSGNVYVTGYSEATWSGPSGQPPLHAYSDWTDFVVVKLNGNGAYQWHTFYGSSGDNPDGDDIAYGIAVGGSGNAYITGTSRGTWTGPSGEPPLHTYSGQFDLAVMRLNEGPTQYSRYYLPLVLRSF
jgi:hypothetical protein